jgi:hypothetical protein
MTGSGGVINSGGTFALGNTTTNIAYNGSTLYLNGNIIATGNVNTNAITEQGGSSANNSVTAAQGTLLLQGSYVTPTQYGSVSIVVNIYIVWNSWNDQVTYPPYDYAYFSLNRCYANGSENSLRDYGVPPPTYIYGYGPAYTAQLISFSVFDTLADNSSVFYRVRGGDSHSAHYYQARSLIVISTKR